MADSVQVKVPTINEHLKRIYAGGELEKNPTIRKFRIVRSEGREATPRIKPDAGQVAKEVASRLALEQFDQFQVRRLSAEAQVDERAFEEAVKKLPEKMLDKPSSE